MEHNPEAAGDDIVLDYELTYADYAAMAHASRSVPARIAKEVAVWLLLTANIAFFMAGVGNDPLAWVSGAIAVLIIVWRFAIEPWMARSHFVRMELGGKQGVMRLGETGIRLSVASLSSDIGWDAVQRISRTPDQLLFWISKAQAVIVPRRALRDAEQEERLLSLARRKTNKNVE